jgi:hypothetical protein
MTVCPTGPTAMPASAEAYWATTRRQSSQSAARSLGLNGVRRLGPDLPSPPSLQISEVRLDDQLMKADHRIGHSDNGPPVQ